MYRRRPRDIGSRIARSLPYVLRSKAQCRASDRSGLSRRRAAQGGTDRARPRPCRCSGIKAASLERMMTVFPTLFVSHGAPNLVLHESPARDFFMRFGHDLGKEHGRPQAILI